VRIAVIGAGIAGTAAAWAARRAGADVTAIHDRAGASSLYAGALDVVPWGSGAADGQLDSEVLAFATALEPWSVGTRGVRVATYEGVLREARGRDSALLDVAPLAGRSVAVVAAPIDGWDARYVARSLSTSAWAVRTRTRFEAVALNGTGVVDAASGRASAYDIAALHDDPPRLAALGERLRAVRGVADAFLLGPWLGTTPGVAETLSAAVGKPCGETTSPPGGPAGARFDAARDALLAATGVQVRRDRIDAIEPRASRFLVVSKVGALTANDAGFDAVVLATGGLVGGGIVLDQGSEGQGAVFRSAVRAALEIGADGRPMDGASLQRGLDIGTHGIHVLERAGILADGAVARGGSGLLVAGDCVADAPRTALAAASAGIRAARKATAAIPPRLRPAAAP
jgi:glycerol-3-phosphate dehydrogenase subunit B